MNKKELQEPAVAPADTDDDAVEVQPAVEAMIGQHLKAHYDDLVNAPVPDTILLLLAQLEAKELGQ